VITQSSVTNAAIDYITMPKYLITIVGPTAIGKTAMGIKLANYFSTEIISADSRQFYKEMQIGTAVPTREELKAAPHHFIHHKSIDEAYSVGDFGRDATQRLNELFKRHNQIIMVGGSGLYVDAVTKGLDKFPQIKPNIRKQLNGQLESEGLDYLKFQLEKLDPIAFEKIAIDNPHRVIRALEVSISSGKPYSSFLKSKPIERQFKVISIGLTADRAIVYNRINKRVDLMMEAGLLNEAKNLFGKRHLNALNTVGYKELFKFFEIEWELDHAVAEIKKNTRRFAKRQLTWFKKNESTLWFEYDTSIETIIKKIKPLVEFSSKN